MHAENSPELACKKKRVVFSKEKLLALAGGAICYARLRPSAIP
jgi:hypothetical protein